jgi:hypothetical protein
MLLKPLRFVRQRKYRCSIFGTQLTAVSKLAKQWL